MLYDNPSSTSSEAPRQVAKSATAKSSAPTTPNGCAMPSPISPSVPPPD